MSFEDQDIQPTATSTDVPAQTAAPEAAVPPQAPQIPAVAQEELVAAPAGIQVADAGEETEWVFDALEEEAEEEAEDEAYDEAEAEIEADESSADDSEARSEADAGAESGSDAGGAEATSGAAASAGGVSSAWLWGGLGLVAAGAAASGGGGSTPKPDAPSVSLAEDSGEDGDSITNVAVFNVDGLDSGNTWEYSLDGGSTWTAGAGASFEITESGDYEIVVRQSKGNKASDNSNSLSVTIDLQAPEITSGADAVVSENNAEGVLVYEASTSDQTEVTYSLADGGDAGLAIDPETGAVTLDLISDFETKPQYTFALVVTDAAGNSSEKTVTVQVQNLDEVAPSFTSSETASVDENSSQGTVISTVLTDDTADISGGVTFSLAPGSDEAVDINSATGVLTLTAIPDFEAQSSYEITVIASDAAGNQSELNVLISVNNQDEVPPSFTSAATVEVNENVPIGDVFYVAEVDDSADISNGVAFTLAEGSDPAVAIDSASGEVSLVEVPDHETKTEYAFTVIATDEAGNNVSQTVSASVIDLDESAPTITSPANVASVDENTGANQIVYRASATDSGDVSEGVTFSLKAGSAPGLRIDSNTGVVRLVSSPDFEVRSTYNFTVVATDAAGNSTEKSLTLRINDLDEIAPVVLSLNGDSASDTVILTFDEVLDADVIIDTAKFSVSQGGNPLDVALVTVAGNTVTLALGGDLVDGPVQVVYTPGEGDNVKDVSGNELGAFTQMVVSDGYIRGARVYLDANNDGIAQESELLEGVTTDDKGQVVIDGDIGEGTLLIVGGVNTDTGAINKIVMKTAAGSTAANPLTTLVETIKASGKTQQEAEDIVVKGLGLTLTEGQSLSSYDPLADTSENALNARKAVATVAVILAKAADTGADEASTAEVLNTVTENIAATLVEQSVKVEAGEQVDARVSFTADVVQAVLKDASEADILTAEDTAKVVTAAQVIEQTNDIDVIVTEQAKATDTIAPDVPVLSVDEDSDLGFESNDGITSDNSPRIFVDFDETSLTGGAVVAGDVVNVLSNEQIVGTAVVTLADIKAGGVAISVGELADGETLFTASITDKAGNTSELASVLTVVVDTVAPVFSSGDPIAVDENSGDDIQVYTAVATDNSVFVYSLNAEANEALSIDAETGVVTLAGADFETAESYDFSVIAIDIAGNSTTKTLTLQINNIDEVAPEITSVGEASTIDENSGPNQIIYTATSDDSADITAGVVYSLGEGADDALSIDPQSGEVTLSTNPDFETKSLYEFTVVVTDGADNSSSLDVSLDIANLDEIAPTITSPTEIADLAEGGADVVIYTVTSDDSADISNGVVYTLAEGSDPAISVNGNTGEVTLSGLVDFESQDSYSFTVVATDEAGNTTQQTLSLTISDVDEVAPTITSPDTIEAIDENTDAGQIIYTVTSDDSADISDGVTYSLADGASKDLSIDPETGVVTLTVSPDYESQELLELGEEGVYNFTVVATDAAGNQSSKDLRLELNNLDEGAPKFSSSPDAAGVREDLAVGEVVYNAVASDVSPFTYSLSDDSPDNFAIDPDSGAVTLLTALDAETKSQYTFTVVATDTSENIETLTVTLPVIDVDESAPVITSPETIVAIDENTAGPSVIYQVTVDDSGDVSEGVDLTLAPSSDLAIELDAATGEISLIDTPDFEVQSSYTFTIVATDGEGNEATRTLTLEVNNLDEEAPTFDSANQIDPIDENVPIGSLVYQAEVTDDVLDISDGVVFSLSDDSDKGLVIDEDTGAVTFSVSPDFETQPEYTFTVIATDLAGNEATKALSFLINDLDEAKPEFQSAAAASVDENVAVGTLVYTAEASDDSPVTYSLKSAPEGVFAIDATTGEVTIQVEPDAETNPEYSFTVVATDEVGNEAELPVVLTINDLDDAAPTFVSSASGVALTGTPFIYAADAVDTGDDITVEPIQYSLDPNSLDANLLAIDSETGVVTLRDGLLVEGGVNGKATYSFTVLAFDGVNEATPLSVEVSLSEVTQVTGAGVLQQGGIRVEDSQNSDGTYTLSFYIDDSIISNYETVGAFQFEMNYDVQQFAAISGGDFSSDFSTVVPNTEVAGVFVVGAFTFPELVLGSDDALGTLVVQPLVEAGISVTISNAIIGNDDVIDTVITYGDLLQVSGTSENESFVLNGGESEITGGAGRDAYIVTASTGTSTVITDFMPGEDVIDLSAVLIETGYASVTSLGLSPAEDFVAREYEFTDAAVLSLIAENASELDNAFGMVIDTASGVITGFYDADETVDNVDIQTFEINIGSAATDVTLDDLTAGIGGFIA